MKVDILKISDGEESIVIRYREMTPSVNKIISILQNEKTKIWGKTHDQNVCIQTEEILYLESVDDKVFAYTENCVLRIEGSLNSFIMEMQDESFFRCSKSMIINVNRVVSLKRLSSNRIDATMEGGEHIIISMRYAAAFRKLLKGAQ